MFEIFIVQAKELLQNIYLLQNRFLLQFLILCFNSYLFCRINGEPKQATNKQYSSEYKKRVSEAMHGICNFAKDNGEKKCTHLPKKIHCTCNGSGIITSNIC